MKRSLGKSASDWVQGWEAFWEVIGSARFCADRDRGESFGGYASCQHLVRHATLWQDTI